MVPPRWPDEQGRPIPTYPCPRCGLEVAWRFRGRELDQDSAGSGVGSLTELGDSFSYNGPHLILEALKLDVARLDRLDE